MTPPVRTLLTAALATVVLTGCSTASNEAPAAAPSIPEARAASATLDARPAPGTWILPSDRALFAADADILADAGATDGLRSLVHHIPSLVPSDRATVVETDRDLRFVAVVDLDGLRRIDDAPVEAVHAFGDTMIIVVGGLLPTEPS